VSKFEDAAKRAEAAVRGSAEEANRLKRADLDLAASLVVELRSQLVEFVNYVSRQIPLRAYKVPSTRMFKEKSPVGVIVNMSTDTYYVPPRPTGFSMVTSDGRLWSSGRDAGYADTSASALVANRIYIPRLGTVEVRDGELIVRSAYADSGDPLHEGIAALAANLLSTPYEGSYAAIFG